MQTMRHILMADIMGSRRVSGDTLIKQFNTLVESVNRFQGNQLLSRLTITLGDEYQGIAASLPAAVLTMISVEEQIIQLRFSFQLRHVMLTGQLDTPIRHDSAHGMLGPGLTEARETLSTMKRRSWQKPENLFKHARFRLVHPDPELCANLNRLFLVYQGLVDRWKAKDMAEINAFLQHRDYRKVAKMLSKDESSAHRREKSLMINEYLAARELILSVARDASP